MMAGQQGFHKWRWRGVVAWIILFTLATAYAVRLSHDTADRTQTALCAFRQSLQDSVARGTLFLAQNPQGFVSSGKVIISAASLAQTIARQQQTVADLAPLHCEDAA